MIFIPQTLVSVYYKKDLMGRLFLQNRRIFFEYDAAFLKEGLELSPFQLPLKAGIVSPKDRTFDGLFGVFNDSLPDGWGRLLLDRKLIGMGINPGALSPLDRLCFVGSHGMGALSYEPETEGTPSSLPTDLDEIEHEIRATLEGEEDCYVDDLLALGGSSAGARPKIMLKIGGEDWLVKFRSSLDPHDISAIEYAYHLMAVKAGLKVPVAKLFPSRKGLGYFGVKRFDRQEGQCIHMHTIAGLLQADHREPCLDYETIMKVTLFLTRDGQQCEQQFRNAVFNVLSHNRDDHSKNFSYLMDEEGVWTVSPAYDLTFSSGPLNEHSTLVMGEGRTPTKEHLLKLAAVGNIKKDKALEIIEHVLEGVRQWEAFAQNVGVSKKQIKNIGQTLGRL